VLVIKFQVPKRNKGVLLVSFAGPCELVPLGQRQLRGSYSNQSVIPAQDQLFGRGCIFNDTHNLADTSIDDPDAEHLRMCVLWELAEEVEVCSR